MPGGNNPPRAIDGLSGITITHIAIGGSESDSSLFVCLVTDRGILLTYGGGKDGCLGHGDRESVEKPKVITDQSSYTNKVDESCTFSAGQKNVVKG